MSEPSENDYHPPAASPREARENESRATNVAVACTLASLSSGSGATSGDIDMAISPLKDEGRNNVGGQCDAARSSQGSDAAAGEQPSALSQAQSSTSASVANHNPQARVQAGALFASQLYPQNLMQLAAPAQVQVIPIDSSVPTENQNPQQAQVNEGVNVDAQAQGGVLFPSQLYPPQNPYAASMSSMFNHPMFAQAHYATLHPQFQQMTPQQQQQMLLFQQQYLIMQQMAQQSMQQQMFQQYHQHQAQPPPHAANPVPNSNGNGPSSQGHRASAMENAQVQHVMAQQQAMLQQYLLQQSIQQQLLQHQQQTHFQAPNSIPANQPLQPEPSSHQGEASATQQQQAESQATMNPPTFSSQAAQQAPNNINHNMTHPFFWNLPNPLGIEASGIEAIYQADESDYQAQNNHDSDDDEDEDDNIEGPGHKLLRLVEDHRWVASLQRIATHPRETQQVGIQGRTPLHVACDHDAPPALVQALLTAWPEGAERVGTSHMNPLHITCSSPHASVEVVRVLLAGCRDSLMSTGAKDVDGDTPLHAACRCAAPMDVLVTLLQANPITVTWKDYEGLNPLFRLWVRYFVLVGEHIISNIKRPSDIKGDLVEAWEKSLLLLQYMSHMEHEQKQKGAAQQKAASPFRVVHAAASVDCPRCVVRIAKVLFPQELLFRDEKNRLPIHIAAAAPVYAVHDLRGEGFTLDDVDFDEDPETRAARMKNKECKYKEPSVIDILLSGDPSAARERDPHGQLPLHAAIMRGKKLEEGVQALVNAHPEALTTPDSQTNLYPFMLAASVGRGRGDCSTIYKLLRAAPDLVHMALTGEVRDEEEGGGKSDLDERKPAAVKT